MNMDSETRNEILKDITLAPIDLQAVQKTIDTVMEYMATNDLPFADGFKVLQELQEHINMWQMNTNNLIEIMNRIGVPLEMLEEQGDA